MSLYTILILQVIELYLRVIFFLIVTKTSINIFFIISKYNKFINSLFNIIENITNIEIKITHLKYFKIHFEP